jgi:hypothetical protein
MRSSPRRRRILWLLVCLSLMGMGVWFAVGTWIDNIRLGERRHHLGTMLLACKLYAGDHGGAMPPDLPAVFPKYIQSETYLAYVKNEVNYFPGLTDQSNPASVLIQEKEADSKGRRWVGHMDGAQILVTDPDRP